MNKLVIESFSEDKDLNITRLQMKNNYHFIQLITNKEVINCNIDGETFIFDSKSNCFDHIKMKTNIDIVSNMQFIWDAGKYSSQDNFVSFLCL